MIPVADKIVTDPDWSIRNSTKGHTKYKHLLDGNAREIDIRDYGYTVVENFRIMVTALARRNGLVSHSRKMDMHHLLFQVVGERED
jgi:hypothetical protein